MSASRIKALVKKVRGDGITAERLRNLEVLVALSLLLDGKTWSKMNKSLRQKTMQEELLPLLMELNACIWQAISDFYDVEMGSETEEAFNNVRCRLSQLQRSEDVAELLATA